MITDEFYQKYLNKDNKIDQEIRQLKNEHKSLINDLASIQNEYDSATKKGDFENAKKYYSQIKELEHQLTIHNDLIKVKTDTVPAIKRNNLFELLNEVNDLQSFYIKEAEEIRGKVNKVIREYNEIIEEVRDINERYYDEFMTYHNLYYYMPIGDKGLFDEKYGNWICKHGHILTSVKEIEEVEIF